MGVPRRILIVDDSEYFRRSARDLLVTRGFEVAAVVGDGEAARATIDEARPDGVLLDVSLPGEDGFSVASALSALRPTATIVLTSSDVSVVPESVLTDCGAAAFVPKTELATADLDRLFGD